MNDWQINTSSNKHSEQIKTKDFIVTLWAMKVKQRRNTEEETQTAIRKKENRNIENSIKSKTHKKYISTL